MRDLPRRYGWPTMRQAWPTILSAILVAGVGLASALLLGAHVDAAVLALAAGALAVAIVLRGGPEDASPAPVAPEPAAVADRRRELLEALGDPALLVEARRIAVANAPARALLGARIEGEDVRLALRHPAATERLAGPAPAAGTADLTGIGAPEKRWRMTIADAGAGARLVLLEDRSAVHAAEKMRTDFVANASHELRTPLATLLGFIETLASTKAGADRATRERFLGIMAAEARRLRQLVDDLISLSRIEAERFQPPEEVLDLCRLATQSGENQQALAAQRGSLVVIAPCEGLPPVAGDRSQLLQMLDNLLANALHHGRPGTPVRVTFDVRQGGGVRLRIHNQGEAIGAEHLPRLTERFYRADPSRSRQIGGTGLGLSIVKHIVERHQGRLLIESDASSGTTVTVDLPGTPAEHLSHKSHGTVA